MTIRTKAHISNRGHALPARLCDLVVVKTRRSCAWSWLLAALVAVGNISLQAQSNAPGAGAAHTIASATGEADTNHAASATPETAPQPEPASKPAPPSGKLDYSSFKIVSDRNIFNGNRSGTVFRSTRSSTQQRSVRVESFSLVGTLLSEDRNPVAFFDGTGSEFKKALKQGGNIAGFTVKEILHTGVRLVNGTNTLDVRVGYGMRREDAGLWKFSTTSASYASTSSSSYSDGNDNNTFGRSFSRNSSDNGRNGFSGRSSRGERDNDSGTSTASRSDAPPVDAAEILKRLMEKREKE